MKIIHGKREIMIKHDNSGKILGYAIANDGLVITDSMKLKDVEDYCKEKKIKLKKEKVS